MSVLKSLYTHLHDGSIHGCQFPLARGFQSFVSLVIFSSAKYRNTLVSNTQDSQFDRLEWNSFNQATPLKFSTFELTCTCYSPDLANERQD